MWSPLIIIILMSAKAVIGEDPPGPLCPELDRDCNPDAEFEYNGHTYVMPKENQLNVKAPGDTAEDLESLLDHHICIAQEEKKLAVIGDSRSTRNNNYIVEAFDSYREEHKRLCWPGSGGPQAFGGDGAVDYEGITYDIDVDVFVSYEGVNLREGLFFYNYFAETRHVYDFEADEMYDFYTKFIHLLRTHKKLKLKSVGYSNNRITIDCGVGWTGMVLHDGRHSTTTDQHRTDCVRAVFGIFEGSDSWNSPDGGPGSNATNKPSATSKRAICFGEKTKYKEKTYVFVKSKVHAADADSVDADVPKLYGCRAGETGNSFKVATVTRAQRLSKLWAAHEHTTIMVPGTYLIDLDPEDDFYPHNGLHNSQTMQTLFSNRFDKCKTHVYPKVVDGWMLRNHGHKMVHPDLKNMTMPGMPKISNCTNRVKRATGFCFLQCFGFGPIGGGSDGVSKKWGNWADKSIKKLDKEVLETNRELGALETATKHNLQLLVVQMETLYNTSIETRKLIASEAAGLAQLQWEIEGARLQIEINEANIKTLDDALAATAEGAPELVPNYWTKGPDGCYNPPSGSLSPITVPTIAPNPTFHLETVAHSTFQPLPSAPPVVSDDFDFTPGIISGIVVGSVVVLVLIIGVLMLCCKSGAVPFMIPM